MWISGSRRRRRWRRRERRPCGAAVRPTSVVAVPSCVSETCASDSSVLTSLSVALSYSDSYSDPDTVQSSSLSYAVRRGSQNPGWRNFTE